MKKLIAEQWKAIYTYWHGIYPFWHCHHINNRRGVFVACKLLIVPLSRQNHEEEHRTHKLRTANMDLIRDISKHWDKRRGCQFVHHDKCLSCPLLDESLKQVVKDQENKLISDFFKMF